MPCHTYIRATIRTGSFFVSLLVYARHPGSSMWACLFSLLHPPFALSLSLSLSRARTRSLRVPLSVTSFFSLVVVSFTFLSLFLGLSHPPLSVSLSLCLSVRLSPPPRPPLLSSLPVPLPLMNVSRLLPPPSVSACLSHRPAPLLLKLQLYLPRFVRVQLPNEGRSLLQLRLDRYHGQIFFDVLGCGKAGGYEGRRSVTRQRGREGGGENRQKRRKRSEPT